MATNPPRWLAPLPDGTYKATVPLCLTAEGNIVPLDHPKAAFVYRPEKATITADELAAHPELADAPKPEPEDVREIRNVTRTPKRHSGEQP